MKRFLLLLLCLSLVLVISSGCSKDDEPEPEDNDEGYELADDQVDWDKVTLKQYEAPKSGDTIAVLHTSLGDITVRFFPEEAPLAVENFLAHAQDGYYDGVLFHRVMYEFMIQSGDPLTKDESVSENRYGKGGESIWSGGFSDEFSPNLYNFRGALSMANTGAANSNGSQFFIVQATTISDKMYSDMLDPEVWWFNEDIANKYQSEGGAPWLDRHHTVFGHVIEGMDVVDSIAAVPVKDPDNADQNLRNYTPVDPVVIRSIEVKTYQ